MTTQDIILIIVVLGVPVICSLTMGKNGTYSDTMKFITTFVLSAVAVAYHFYSLGYDFMSILLDTVGGTVLFGAIGFVIISYFDKIWKEQEETRKELEREEERNRELRDKLRERENKEN